MQCDDGMSADRSPVVALLPSYAALFQAFHSPAAQSTSLGWTGQGDPSLLTGHTLLPVGLSEWMAVATHLPIVLLPHPIGSSATWLTAAVMGLTPDHNHCLNDQGQWLPPVQPTALRLLPFGLHPDSQQLLGYAAHSSCFGQGGGLMPLFSDTGQPTPALAQRRQRTEAFAADLEAAAAAAAQLASMELLSPLPAHPDITLDPTLQRAMLINAQALNQLSASTLQALHSLGLLGPAYGLQIAAMQLPRLQRLVKVMQQQKSQPQAAHGAFSSPQRRNQPQPAAAASGHAGGPRQPRDPITGQPLA